MASLNITSKLALKSGYEMPILGFGVFQTSSDETEAAVRHALKTGYRHIDSATCYFNEGPCARAMASSGIPRSCIFFTSKVYSNALSYDDTSRQVDSTLKLTGLGYIDLMLIHAPYGGPSGRKAAWRALVDAQEAGKVRSLGVSNYGVHHLNELEIYIKELEAERGSGRGGVISVGQWELQPWLAHPDIVDWCRERNMVVQAFSPLTRAKRLNDPLLRPIVERTRKTAAQVLMRWSLQMGFSPLPKSVRPAKIEENANIYDFELTEDEMGLLDTGKYERCAWDPTVLSLDQ
ncbi:MAG: hypothetical protein ALECFALPRED_007376 [Alectoria fallacina]|uniref:NADP-dependent oxidoreductase domain-containing protein n=1 Tax=Alectoria fallacina TaxID=1903189 RepID=A0A8H3GAM2_9LECA|nr:MAG: hypothetical protein ALECFALPRED_007376 [Alectoria fallacina]